MLVLILHAPLWYASNCEVGYSLILMVNVYEDQSAEVWKAGRHTVSCSTSSQQVVVIG